METDFANRSRFALWVGSFPSTHVMTTSTGRHATCAVSVEEHGRHSSPRTGHECAGDDPSLPAVTPVDNAAAVAAIEATPVAAAAAESEEDEGEEEEERPPSGPSAADSRVVTVLVDRSRRMGAPASETRSSARHKRRRNRNRPTAYRARAIAEHTSFARGATTVTPQLSDDTCKHDLFCSTRRDMFPEEARPRPLAPERPTARHQWQSGGFGLTCNKTARSTQSRTRWRRKPAAVQRGAAGWTQSRKPNSEMSPVGPFVARDRQPPNQAQMDELTGARQRRM